MKEKGKEKGKNVKDDDDEDEGGAYLQIGNLIPNRKYRFKVMVNMRYRPTPQQQGHEKQGQQQEKSKNSNPRLGRGIDDSNDIRLSRAGYLTILTQPDHPQSPIFLDSDIIHYDHKIPIDKSSMNVIPSQIQRSIEEEIENLLDDHGISVVDKLKKYNDMVNSKKTPIDSTKTLNQTMMKTSSLKSSSKLLKSLDIQPPVDHRNGLTERRISCRLHWTIPYSNGNSVIEYQIQKL